MLCTSSYNMDIFYISITTTQCILNLTAHDGRLCCISFTSRPFVPTISSFLTISQIENINRANERSRYLGVGVLYLPHRISGKLHVLKTEKNKMSTYGGGRGGSGHLVEPGKVISVESFMKTVYARCQPTRVAFCSSAVLAYYAEPISSIYCGGFLKRRNVMRLQRRSCLRISCLDLMHVLLLITNTYANLSI